MSWISDVNDELQHLKKTEKELHKFAYLVGGVFILVALAGLIKRWDVTTSSAIGLIGISLMVLGGLAPASLKKIYTIWMGFAFALGWVISRLILLLLFYVIITPIGVAARLRKKKFIDIAFPAKGESFWIAKRAPEKINYDKMV